MAGHPVERGYLSGDVYRGFRRDVHKDGRMEGKEVVMSGDWEELTKEQQEALNAVRDRMGRHIMAEAEAFYVHHPEIRLTWNFTCEGLIREKHPVILQPL